MTVNKEAELTSAVMRFAVRCLQEGDKAALREMNFGPAEVQALKELTMGDLCQLDSVRSHCLSVALNRQAYWPIVSKLRSNRESEELQHALVAADAPLDMLQTFFGMGGREYSRLRQTLMVTMTVGRPTEPSEDEIEKLWAAWQQRESMIVNSLLPPEEYLRIHEETGVSVRTIWRQTRTWLDYD